MAKNFFLTPIGLLGILCLAKSKGKNDRVMEKHYEQVLKLEKEWK